MEDFQSWLILARQQKPMVELGRPLYALTRSLWKEHGIRLLEWENMQCSMGHHIVLLMVHMVAICMGSQSCPLSHQIVWGTCIALASQRLVQRIQRMWLPLGSCMVYHQNLWMWTKTQLWVHQYLLYVYSTRCTNHKPQLTLHLFVICFGFAHTSRLCRYHLK